MQEEQPPDKHTKSHFLNPGELYFGSDYDQITTLLGSCIAITLWHPDLLIGGMCHFILPNLPADELKTKVKPVNYGRYGEGAIELFENAVKNRNTQLSDYQAKIFGGGCMIDSCSQDKDELIGIKNAHVAMKLLAERQVPVFSTHIGQTGYRKIIFDVTTGDVWVKHEPIIY